MLIQLDFSSSKSTTENQRKSNVGKPYENSMVWSVLQGRLIISDQCYECGDVELLGRSPTFSK